MVGKLIVIIGEILQILSFVSRHLYFAQINKAEKERKKMKHHKQNIGTHQNIIFHDQVGRSQVRNAGMVKYTKFCQCNLPYKQNERI